MNNKMPELIIDDGNVTDVSAEIIAALMNSRVLPHDVSQETFVKWMKIVERHLRREADLAIIELENTKAALPKCEICGGDAMHHFYHPDDGEVER